MAVKNNAMSRQQLKALKTTDLSPFIGMAGMMMPRALSVFIATLNEKEKSAFDKVMPAGGGKKIYLHLAGTPTPPIVIGFAQPLKMSTVPESEVKKQQIKGIRLTIEDVQALAERRIGKIVWRLKGRLLTLLGFIPIFWPFVRLGPRGMKELQDKAMKHFKPIMDMMPR
jgi:hypothetical protein